MSNRTAKLWLLYMDQTETLKLLFIRSERTGSMDLNLFALQKNVEYFCGNWP